MSAHAPAEFTTDSFQLFLNQADRYPLLTGAEEIELAKRIERGDLEAKEKLINSNLRLVVKFASRYQGHGLSLQDLVQGAGVEGEDLGLAAEDIQGLVDLAGGDRADRAQVLGQDQVGAQVADGLGVEPVDRLSAADTRADQPVDLGWFGGRRQGRARHHPHPAGLGWPVAFVGDPDQVSFQPQGVDDFRGAR